MTAEIIPFPGLIEYIARRILPIMSAPRGDRPEAVFGRAMDALGVGDDDGLILTDAQWGAVWRRVDELMEANKRVGGGAR